MELATVTVEGEDFVPEVEKPMTKTEAYEWIKRIRENLRMAEQDIYKGGDTQEFINAIMDAQGSCGELLAAVEEPPYGGEARGIRGLR